MDKQIQKDISSKLRLGVIKENPVFVLALSLTPVLAVTNDLSNAMALGFIVLIVTTLSNVIVSLFSKMIPDSLKMLTQVLIVAFIVSVVEMSMRGSNPELFKALGIYLPLTAVSGVVIQRSLTFAHGQSFVKSLIDGLSYGLGFWTAIVVVAIIRSIASTGAVRLFGVQMRIFDVAYSFTALDSGFGALLTVGLLLGFYQSLRNRGNES